jgi:TonB family protein
MRYKRGTILALLLAAGALLIVALRLLLMSPKHLGQTDLQSNFSIEAPFDVMISCDVHKQSGWTPYGGDAPITVLFTGCKPQGDFNIVAGQSSAEEARESKTRPELSFLLTASGEVKNVILTRSSGSQSVDRKVVQMVRERHYPPTNCGTCTVSARVPINLKCDDSRQQ